MAFSIELGFYLVANAWEITPSMPKSPINPPAKNKRNYWVADKPVKGQAAEKWFAQATEYPGSWWRDWGDWLATHSGKRVKASKTLGNQSYPVLEKAPGSYVKVRAV